MKSEPRAPIGRVFTSVEGESSRIGELTSFVHIADGIYRTPSQALGLIHENVEPIVTTLVLDPCEASYFDWSSFAAAFIHEAREKKWRKIVLETRGERESALDLEVPIYLHLTPGLTVLKPKHLKAGRDEVKFLVHDEKSIPAAMAALNPFASRGIASFILPRVGRDIDLARICFGYYLTHENPHGVRMMLIEHEVTGID